MLTIFNTHGSRSSFLGAVFSEPLPSMLGLHPNRKKSRAIERSKKQGIELMGRRGTSGEILLRKRRPPTTGGGHAVEYTSGEPSSARQKIKSHPAKCSGIFFFSQISNNQYYVISTNLLHTHAGSHLPYSLHYPPPRCEVPTKPLAFPIKHETISSLPRTKPPL